MSVASLHYSGHPLHLDNRVKSIAALSLLAVMFAAPHAFEALSLMSVAFYSLFFYLISSGTTLFGLLTSRAARVLGDASYSIYLAQGLFLTLLFSIAAVRSFAFAGTTAFWLVGLAYIVLLSTSASLSYQFIEVPCISFGKMLGRPRKSATGCEALQRHGEPRGEHNRLSRATGSENFDARL